MPLPITNARLLEIRDAGSSGGYRDEDTTGPVKWTGRVGALVEEKVMRNTQGQTLNRLKQTSLVIPGDLKPPFDIETDDEVTYLYRGDTYTRKVQMHEAFIGVGPKIVELFFQDEVEA